MNQYLDFVRKDILAVDVHSYLEKFGRLDTWQHTQEVLEELNHMKRIHGIELQSHDGVLLHDIGRVVPATDAIEFCLLNDLEVTEQESLAPFILHQKISEFISVKVFGVTDKLVLNAVRYHTTLHVEPTNVDIEVFLADKMSWREPEYFELAGKVRSKMEQSKEQAIMFYLQDMFEKRNELKIYHRDSVEAYQIFCCDIKQQAK